MNRKKKETDEHRRAPTISVHSDYRRVPAISGHSDHRRAPIVSGRSDHTFAKGPIPAFRCIRQMGLAHPLLFRPTDTRWVICSVYWPPSFSHDLSPAPKLGWIELKSWSTLLFKILLWYKIKSRSWTAINCALKRLNFHKD